MVEQTQYKKYTITLDGKNTYVYASKFLNLKEEKVIKGRMVTSKNLA